LSWQAASEELKKMIESFGGKVLSKQSKNTSKILGYLVFIIYLLWLATSYLFL